MLLEKYMSTLLFLLKEMPLLLECRDEGKCKKMVMMFDVLEKDVAYHWKRGVK